MKSAAFKEQNYQFKIKVNMKTKTSILALTKAFFILLVMCCLFSCNNGKGKISTDVQVIDGCEYIVSRNSYGNVVSHKGNCNNPIHKQVIHDTIYVVKAK
jgi:hypothetical protein